MPDPQWTEVRDYTGRVMAQHSIPAVALAAAVDGREVFAEGFGVRELNAPGTVGTVGTVGTGGAVGAVGTVDAVGTVGAVGTVTPDMIFGVASVSKGFTALAIMQLAEAGRLSVDDSVVRYLPGYRTRDAAGSAATTLHHFLTHTAGLPPLPSRFFALARVAALDPFASARPAWVADHPPIDDADQLVDYLAELDVQPLGSPGEHFSYSNEGFALLGAIVERVAEQPFADYVTDHILTPLGMQRSSFDRRPLTGRPDVATLHAMREIGEADGPADVQPAELPTYVPLWYAAGGLNSTTRDLLRYLEIYRTGGVSHGARLLSADGIARMLTPHTRSTVPGTWYGYGLRLRPDYHGTRLVQHGGGSKGISSQVMVAPDRGITAVALTNLADVPSERLALAPVNTLLGLPVDTPPDEYPTAQYPVSTMARYAGSYRGGEGTEVRVALPGEQLMVTLGGRELPARPVGDHGVLVSPPSGETYLRFLVSDGAPAWAVSVNSRILPRVE